MKQVGCKRPVYDPENSVWVLETHGMIRKVLYVCKRPAVSSGKFCVSVRDLRCEPKSSVAQRRHTVMFIT